jgi:hypothetical protein
MDDPAFAVSVDDTTQTILLAAANHDLETLKPLLRVPGAASVQDPETGFTPLHAAIQAVSIFNYIHLQVGAKCHSSVRRLTYPLRSLCSARNGQGTFPLGRDLE